MILVLGWIFTFLILGLIVNGILFFLKMIKYRDTSRQKKILLINGVLLVACYLGMESFSSDDQNQIVTADSQSNTQISSTTESTSRKFDFRKYANSNSSTNGNNQNNDLNKGKLADQIKTELSSLSLSSDEMNDTLFAHNTILPDYTNYYQIYPYLGVNGLDSTDNSDFDNAWSNVNIYGIVRFSYVDDDWLFAKSIEIKTDDNKYSIDPDYNDWKRDNESGEVWEWYNAPLNSSTVDMYNDIANSSYTLIRLHGDTYYDDRYITEDEKSALKQILSVYNNYLELQTLI